MKQQSVGNVYYTHFASLRLMGMSISTSGAEGAYTCFSKSRRNADGDCQHRG